MFMGITRQMQCLGNARKYATAPVLMVMVVVVMIVMIVFMVVVPVVCFVCMYLRHTRILHTNFSILSTGCGFNAKICRNIPECDS